MDILFYKVKHEEELEKSNKLLRENNKLLKENYNLKVKMLETELKNTRINQAGKQNIAGNNNIQDNSQHITINNYNAPNLENIKITTDTLTAEQTVVQSMLAILYCNPDVPENYCIYIPNQQTCHIMYMLANGWRIAQSFEEKEKIRCEIANIIHKHGKIMVNKMLFNDDDKKFEELEQATQNLVIAFNGDDKKESELTMDRLTDTILKHKAIIKPVYDANRKQKR
jgi:hypothetical protein